MCKYYEEPTLTVHKYDICHSIFTSGDKLDDDIGELATSSNPFYNYKIADVTYNKDNILLIQGNSITQRTIADEIQSLIIRDFFGTYSYCTLFIIKKPLNKKAFEVYIT